MRRINKTKYYTAREARAQLGGIHSTTLKRYVDSGKLSREVPPGYKQGVYLKNQVDELARGLRQYYEDPGSEEPQSTEGIYGSVTNSA